MPDAKIEEWVSEVSCGASRFTTEDTQIDDSGDTLLDEKEYQTPPREPPRHLNDTWIIEILFMIISLGSFISIAVILGLHDGQMMPEFWLGITLNTIISALATLGKGTLLITVANCLSQFKWAWFVGPGQKSLLEFQRLDEASRGMWGSIKLLSTRL
jgi:hypothetical protein